MKNIDPIAKIAQSHQFVDYINRVSLVDQANIVSIEVSLTGACNATCPWCFYREDPINGQKIKKKALIKFLNSYSSLKSVTFVGGGEPTLHPDFRGISDSVKQKKALITNGLRVPDYDFSGFDWVRVSKTDRPWNVDGLKILRRASTLGLAVNYTGDKKSYDSVLEAAEIAHEVKANYVQVRPALNIQGETTNIICPTFRDPIISVMKYKFDECDKKHSYKKCRAFNLIPFLWHNGDLSVCCYHKDSYVLGNIYRDQKILFPLWVKVRDNCQVCCKLHDINKFIDRCKKVINKEWP